MNSAEINMSQTSNLYKKEMIDALKLSFPNLYEDDIKEAVNYSILKRANDSNAVLDNNYEKKKEKTTLFAITDYIVQREPIITVSGVMFRKHGYCPNPYVMLIQEFLNSRTKYKKEMFKYPKGSEEYEKYNILQLSEKVSGNAIYGASGMHTSIFYNLYVAQSITMQGRSCISAAILLFEATMANNVKFTSLSDVVTFINNVRRENNIFTDNQILDDNISIEECFFKIIYSCGFYWNPTEKEITILWDMLNQCTQHEINRLFYKNNLFWFVENRYVINLIINILSTLKTPFIDPNDIPEEIKPMMDELYNLIYEFVYYDKQYLDRLDRTENMYRCVSVLTDTDSCFISFDGWYRFILDKTFNIPMSIKEVDIDETTNEVKPAFEKRYDYDFYTDEVIEMEENLRPDVITPQVGYRCSIINILASIMGKLSIDYMNKYARNSNSTICHDGSERVSFFILKNEFQLKRALVTYNKKNYCSYQERQESSIIPAEKALDVKGMPITKVGLPEVTKTHLKQILFDYILNNYGEISQLEIVKQLAIFEKQIMGSILSGDKTFFKPVRIKAFGAYEDPMRNFGIKASLVYNELRVNGEEPIDLDQRNSILVIKVDINEENAEKIKDVYPDRYERIMKLLETKEFCKGITKIAIMDDWNTPEWLKTFINYTEIINDNLKVFPCEPLGINRRGKDTINYTNVVSIY